MYFVRFYAQFEQKNAWQLKCEGHFKLSFSKVSLDYIMGQMAFQKKNAQPSLRRKSEVSFKRRAPVFRNGVSPAGFLLRTVHEGGY